MDRMFDEELKAASRYVHGRVLDIGCGNGRYRGLPGGSSYIGLDLRGAADVNGDACFMPFSPASIDTALCFNMLDDVPEPLKLLREIHRVLKPSGTLLLSASQSWRVHDAPHDYFRFTSYGLAWLTSQAGFSADSIKPLGGLWALIATRIAFRVHETLGTRRLIRPFVWPLGFSILLCGLILDKLDFRPEDTALYFVRATKLSLPPPAGLKE